MASRAWFRGIVAGSVPLVVVIRLGGRMSGGKRKPRNVPHGSQIMHCAPVLTEAAAHDEVGGETRPLAAHELEHVRVELTSKYIS